MELYRFISCHRFLTMLRYLTLVLLVSTQSLDACICFTDPLTPDTFTEYDFVALIRIKQAGFLAGPHQEERKFGYEKKYVWFETIEQYQGASADWLVELGAYGSCGLHIDTGEEWIIYGEVDSLGQVEASGCTHSGLYRRATGESAYYGVAGLSFARSYCGGGAAIIADTGPDTLKRFFTSGLPELVEPYFNGRQHGERKLYHPNGELRLVTTFDAGTVCGRTTYFSCAGMVEYVDVHDDSGNRMARETYDSNSFRIKTTVYGKDWTTHMDIFYHSNGLPRFTNSFEKYELREQKMYSPFAQLIFHATFSEDRTHTVVLDLREEAERLPISDF